MWYGGGILKNHGRCISSWDFKTLIKCLDVVTLKVTIMQDILDSHCTAFMLTLVFNLPTFATLTHVFKDFHFLQQSKGAL